MASILYIKKYGEKTFYGFSVKEAYMKACKWYATYIISKCKFKDAQVEIQKNESKRSVTLVLYTSIQKDEVDRITCECCREVNMGLFLTGELNCDTCKAKSLMRRSEKMLAEKAKYCSSTMIKTIKREKEAGFL